MLARAIGRQLVGTVVAVLGGWFIALLLLEVIGCIDRAQQGYPALDVVVMLGGAWEPSFIFPQWLQKLSLIVPTRWAVDGRDAMTGRGLGMHAALARMAVLLGFTFGFGMLAFYKFRRDGQHGV